jgi:hypothetical protein
MIFPIGFAVADAIAEAIFAVIKVHPPRKAWSSDIRFGQGFNPCLAGRQALVPPGVYPYL